MQIIKRYYGRSEISDGDLEGALQVGMTPHERRRFEKKRGFSFKRSTASAAAVPQWETRADCAPRMSNEETNSEVDREDDLGKPSLASDLAVDGPTSNGNTILVKARNYNESIDSAVNVDKNLNRRQPDVVSDLSYSPRDEEPKQAKHDSPRDEELAQAKHNSKLSLLGHGPHGKQVVDHLLEKYGEEGIREFCQRWRQAFVDALNPRFLPAGWDVKHRYFIIIIFYLFSTTNGHPDPCIISLCILRIYFILSIFFPNNITIYLFGGIF